MRLSTEKILRIIAIYTNMSFSSSCISTKNEATYLRTEASLYPLMVLETVKKWQKTGSIIDFQNELNSTKHTRICNRDILRIPETTVQTN